MPADNVFEILVDTWEFLCPMPNWDVSVIRLYVSEGVWRKSETSPTLTSWSRRFTANCYCKWSDSGRADTARIVSNRSLQCLLTSQV